MNDLTKEELLQIKFHMDMCHSIFDASFTSEMCIDLEDKIQSMIDNYCDHENDEKFNAIPMTQSLKMCKKCQKFYT